MAFLQKNLAVYEQVRRIKRELEGVAARCDGPVGETLLTQAALISSEQRSLAPVDSASENPGALRDSIRVEQGTPTAKRAIVVKIKAGGAKTRKQSASGKAYDYARAVEFGTQNMPAQPFFNPVWRARRKQVRAVIRKKIKLVVRDTFK